ncbi:glycosyl hydrolase family 28-related protein [Kutzneria sp. CA-103260]|uniref:glycosyl hydrolase family 28-related protein n=1 Tax=Kutzneria sp. CA-103260 TaxID=2802641 RepID=UPI001BA9CBD3|nr:glycosyl hydrolase family 28-related protein [Kutzneria sp. CA-103260]QUQ62561.1 Pectate lyase superfamily protein [Kutzneria sp. CA-103260]
MTRRLLVLLGLLVTLVAALAVPATAAPVWYPNGIGADLGPNPLTLGVTATAGDNAAGLRTGTVGGHSYWQTDVSAGTSHLDFAPDPDYTVAGPVVAMVTYYDSGTGAISLNGVSVATLAGSNTWKQAATTLPALASVRLSGGVSDITVAQIRITAAGPTATLGSNATNTGVTPNPGDNPSGLVTGTAAGRDYWQTNAAAPAPATNYFYMNVADSYAYNTTNVVLVSVDYLDAGNGTLDLQYDSPGNDLPQKFKPSEIVHYGDTGTWQTHDFVLSDAILTNRTNGSDFRIAHDGSNVEVKVAAVRVTVIPSALDVKAGLRNLVAQANLTVYGAREGARDGQYPAGSKAAFSAQIAKAQAVVDDQNATPAQVKAAQQALYDSYQAFKASAVNTNVAAGKPLSTGPGWTQVDLGRAQPVSDVFVQWGPAFSHDYKVQTSVDGSSFTTVGESGATDPNSVSRTDFPAVTARYVRLAYDGTANVSDLQVRNQRVVTPKPQLIKTKYPTADPVIADFVVSGADPNGVKDSTKALQAALYDCYDAGGGTVWLPDGTYRVTDTVEVPAFCTLRGDRRDPDHGSGSYGTVISADLPSGDNGPVLFRIGGSAGVIGLTTYYPHQSATSPVPYSYTFEITGSAWASDENYMMGTVSDVTMLNSYRGIGISTMLDERGRPPAVGQTHESATVRNVRGTALFEGVEAYNGADVGTWENITFSNSYWASAPLQYNPPSRSTMDVWTRAHGTGFVLGDLEWDQFNTIAAADYHVGIHIVPGQRVDFAGAFQGVELKRTDTALLVEQFDSRWGLMIGGGILDGAVTNQSAGFVKLTDVKVTGAISGIVYQLAGKAPAYDTSQPSPRPSRNALYVTDASHGNGFVPAADATAGIQRTLDRAGRDGGGTVYLPAGWYRVSGQLVVPAGVELRGASALPNRDEDGKSGGTVLMSYSGRGTATPDTDPALVTLNGSDSGVRGLRVFYPGQNPAATDGLVAYPYAIRGHGTGTYVINVGLPNAYNGIDLSTFRNDDFFVGKLSGTFVRHGITVGQSTGGHINGVLSNGNTYARLGFYLPNWFSGSNLFPQVIDGYTRKSSDLITVDGARALTITDAFGYGLHDGLVVNSGDVHVFNLGTDNLGADGYTVKATGGSTTVLNLLRYNGTTSTGPVKLINVMAINMVQSAISVTASAGGTASVAGTETEPGKYENGSSVTATAKAAAGYHFVDWTINGTEVSTSATYTFPVTTNATLTANFTH